MTRLLLSILLSPAIVHAAPTITLSTANGAQSLNGSYIVSSSVGIPLSLEATGSTGAGSVSFDWRQTSGPAVAFSNPHAPATTITTSAFGTASITLTATDSNGSSTLNIKVGGVVTDGHNVVIPADPRVGNVVGLMIRLGANPWTWADDRAVAFAANQIAQQSTLWVNFWSTPSPRGSVSVTAASGQHVVVTGSGTQFQTDFCGAPGNTQPATPRDMIVIWYPTANPAYAGETGRWFAPILSCDSQTRLSLAPTYYPWATGTGAGCSAGTVACNLTYSVGDSSIWSSWTYGNAPGNYYDNVLALYSLYYRSGIDDFATAARYLASAWWTGYLNKAEGYYAGDGNYAGQPRTTAFTGLMLWSFDTGANVWPGLKYLWQHFDYLMVGFNSGIHWNVNPGDLREDGYMMSAFGLCAQYDPDPTDRAMCLSDIHQTIAHIWSPLEINNTWPTINPQPTQNLPHGQNVYGAPDGSVYVTVVDGSPNLALHGSTWSQANFSEFAPYDLWVWFCNDCWGYGYFGFNGHSPVKQNSEIGGDAVAYHISSVTDSTHAVLDRNYDSGGGCPGPAGCRKTMEPSMIAGYGQIPYMHGMLVGALGTYVYQALQAAGPSYAADLALVKKFVQDGVAYLQTSIDPGGQGMFAGKDFITCAGSYQYSNPNCGPGVVLQGEGMRGLSAGYALSQTLPNLNAGDAAYNALWAKPGFSSPVGLNQPCFYNSDIGTLPHCYLQSAENGGFMLTPGASTDNKWFGFYWGYGFGVAWPAVTAAVERVTVLPVTPRLLTMGHTSTSGRLAR